MVPPLLAKIAANDSEIAYRPRPHRLTERWNDPDWGNTPRFHAHQRARLAGAPCP